MTLSALYVGSVNHRRLRPVSHHLRYRMFWLLVDLDELPALGRRLTFFAHNRFNLFSLHDRDHGSRDGTPAVAWARAELAAHGVEAGGKILLLAMPRILGYGFNPLSIYFCHAADGALRAILYEVHNTFRERRTYVIRVAPGADTIEQS